MTIALIVAAKFVLPVLIVPFPFAAGWANFVLDGIDGDLLIPLGLPNDVYQPVDKLSDWVTYVAIVVVGYRNQWPIRRLMLGLFVFRSIGQVAFLLTENELFLPCSRISSSRSSSSRRRSWPGSGGSPPPRLAGRGVRPRAPTSVADRTRADRRLQTPGRVLHAHRQHRPQRVSPSSSNNSSEARRRLTRQAARILRPRQRSLDPAPPIRWGTGVDRVVRKLEVGAPGRSQSVNHIRTADVRRVLGGGRGNGPKNAGQPHRSQPLRAAHPARHVTAAIPTAVYRKGSAGSTYHRKIWLRANPSTSQGDTPIEPQRDHRVGRSRWPRAHRIDSQPMAARAGPQASGLPMDRIWV